MSNFTILIDETWLIFILNNVAVGRVGDLENETVYLKYNILNIIHIATLLSC